MPVKPRVSSATFTSPGGALVIAVSGGVLSTITTRGVLAVLPAWSVAKPGRASSRNRNHFPERQQTF